MPENPLLPNAALQQLYTGMFRARDAATGRPTGMEAILAAVAQQVETGDAILSFAHVIAFGELLRPAKRGVKAAAVLASSASPLAFAAGVAAGAQLAADQPAGAQRLVVAILDTREPESNWPRLLAQAQRDRLPLIVICPDFPAGISAEEASGTLTWAALAQVIGKLRFPVLTVDGEDAVAMYRAMQESILRARHGDGPALLWCLMSQPRTRGKRSGSFSPLNRLEKYLTARRIALPRSAAKPAARS